MSTHPNAIVRAPHPDCQLAHHALESRVGVHQWSDTTKSMEYLFGRVIEHSGRRIKIAVDSPRKTVIEVECGAVFPSPAQFAAGGPLPPGTPLPRFDGGCSYAIPPSVTKKLGHDSGFLAGLNASGPRPGATHLSDAPGWRALPAALETDSVGQRSARMTATEHGATVRASCDGLAAMLIRSFEDVLAGPGYGDASGHLGSDGLSALAEVAIDTVYAYLRGTTDEIVARAGGRTIEITNRDENR